MWVTVFPDLPQVTSIIANTGIKKRAAVFIFDF
jgi:hypothetical protein